MTRRVVSLAFGAVALTLSAYAATPQPPAADPAEEVQDVVFFHDDQPLFLRLRVRLGDQAYRRVWHEAVTRLFRNFDVDQNGEVTPQELNRAGWVDRMRGGPGGAVPVRRAGAPGAPVKAESFPTSRSPDELSQVLRSVLAPLELRNQPKTNDGSENLFERLDRNGDRKLSQSELDAAADALSSCDDDDDELIHASELRAYRNPFFGEGVPQATPANAETTPLVLATSREPHARLAARLIKRYDVGSRDNPREKDRKLAQFEIGLDATSFRDADADSDGALDADELTRFLDRPVPGLEVTINVGTGTKGKTTITASTPSSPARFLQRGLRRPSPGRVDLLDDHVQVEFSPSAPPNRGFDIREFYRNQFTASDADGNKTLDKKETERNGIMNNNFDLMDRDSDGKLTEEEVLGFVDLQIELANSRVFLLVTDRGRALFEALDADRDRRLSTREIRSALRRLSAWDLDADAQLGQDEIPQHFRLTFDHAQPVLLIQIGFNPFDTAQNSTDGGNGPKWFSKMDINHDGDVSPREFLGTAADFRRLDTDGDGLIDRSEAAAVK